MNKHLESLKSGILGAFIGLAVIVPGLSGAQIAIIFKLYDKLMASLAKIFTKKSILFLIPLAIGAVVGLVAGFFGIKYLLEISTVAVVFLFAGLMAGGMPSIVAEVKGTEFKNYYFINAIIGLIIPVVFSFISIYSKVDLSNLVLETPIYFYLIALAIGFLLSLTQLIPGLSATSILLSLGIYIVLMNNISLDLIHNWRLLLVYVCLAVGMVLGILLISKFINKCLINYKTGFYYLIIGLCVGNLCVMFFNPEMYEIYQNPGENFTLELIIGAVLFVVGALIIYLVYRISEKKNKLNNLENINQDTQN